MFRAITSKTLTSASSRLVAKRSVLVHRNSLSLSAVKHDPEAPQSKLDEIFPLVEDFPSHHIGPRKWEAKAMLNELGYNVSSVARNGYFVPEYDSPNNFFRALALTLTPKNLGP